MENMNFQTPYSKWDKIKRLLWNLVWGLFARPFPRNTARKWKIFLLRMFGAKVSWTATVYSSAKVFKPWLLEMRDYSCLAPGVDCYNAAPISIGIKATVSQRAFLCTAGHDITNIRHRQIEKPIIIEDEAWICAEAFVGQGVIVRRGAVVFPRTVVVKNVEEWTVVGGNPAKFIKKRIIKDK